MIARWTYPVVATIYSVLSLLACVSAWNDKNISRWPIIAMTVCALALLVSWMPSQASARTMLMGLGLVGLIGSAIWAGIAEDDLRPVHIIVRILVSLLFAAVFFWRERALN